MLRAGRHRLPDVCRNFIFFRVFKTVVRLKFFKPGNAESVKFRGTRDISSLTSFINEQLDRKTAETEGIEEPIPVRGLTELTEVNFRTATQTGNHFVKFYAPWCGHCQVRWSLMTDSSLIMF